MRPVRARFIPIPAMAIALASLAGSAHADDAAPADAARTGRAAGANPALREPVIEPAQVQQRIDAVQAQSQAALVTEPIAKARAAIERGNRLRALGDVLRAQVAVGIASEWTRLAELTLRAQERKAAELATAREAETEAARADQERGRAEAATARTSSLAAQLQQAQATQLADKNRTDRRAADKLQREGARTPPRPARRGSTPSETQP